MVWVKRRSVPQGSSIPDGQHKKFFGVKQLFSGKNSCFRGQDNRLFIKYRNYILAQGILPRTTRNFALKQGKLPSKQGILISVIWSHRNCFQNRACGTKNGRVAFTTSAHNNKTRAWNLQRACVIKNKRVVLATCTWNLKTGLWNFTTSKWHLTAGVSIFMGANTRNPILAQGVFPGATRAFPP